MIHITAVGRVDKIIDKRGSSFIAVFAIIDPLGIRWHIDLAVGSHLRGTFTEKDTALVTTTPVKVAGSNRGRFAGWHTSIHRLAVDVGGAKNPALFSPRVEFSGFCIHPGKVEIAPYQNSMGADSTEHYAIAYEAAEDGAFPGDLIYGCGRFDVRGFEKVVSLRNDMAGATTPSGVVREAVVKVVSPRADKMMPEVSARRGFGTISVAFTPLPADAFDAKPVDLDPYKDPL